MSVLTAQTVQKIVGQLDEGRILEILKTGASETELVEALEWLHGDDAMARHRHRAPDSRISDLCRILGRHDVAVDEDR